MTWPEVDEFDPNQYLQEYDNGIANCDVRLAGELTDVEREHVTQYRAELVANRADAAARIAEQSKPGG